MKTVEELLYEAIVELSYVQESPTLAIAKSAKGAAIVELGMKMLGVKDLSAATLPEK